VVFSNSTSSNTRGKAAGSELCPQAQPVRPLELQHEQLNSAPADKVHGDVQRELCIPRESEVVVEDERQDATPVWVLHPTSLTPKPRLFGW
jgi:hypothetical protein